MLARARAPSGNVRPPGPVICEDQWVRTPLPPVAAVIGFIDAINRGDADRLAALMSSDHQLHGVPATTSCLSLSPKCSDGHGSVRARTGDPGHPQLPPHEDKGVSRGSTASRPAAAQRAGDLRDMPSPGRVPAGPAGPRSLGGKRWDRLGYSHVTGG